MNQQLHRTYFIIEQFLKLNYSVEVQMSALLADVGLNIREAHVFSTTDGYSLDVFVVDGWPSEVLPFTGSFLWSEIYNSFFSVFRACSCKG